MKRFDCTTLEGILARDTEGDMKRKDDEERALIYGDPYLAEVIRQIDGMKAEFKALGGEE